MAKKYVNSDALARFKLKFQTHIANKIKLTEYTYKFTASTTSSGQTYSIPNYKSATDTLDVYINSFKGYLNTDYTVSGTTLKMSKSITTGTEIYVVIRRPTFTW